MQSFWIKQGGEQRTNPWLYFATLIVVALSFVLFGQIPITYMILKSGVMTDDMVILRGVLGKNPLFFGVLFPFFLAFVTLFIAWRFLLRKSLKSLFTARKDRQFLRGIVAFVLFFCLNFLSFLIFKNDQVVWQFDGSSFMVLLFLALVFLSIQAITEELFFRSFLAQWLGERVNNPWYVLLMTGTLFGLVHAGNPEITALGAYAITYYIWTGFFLGWLVMRDKGLTLAIGYHVANNLFAALIVTNKWQAFETDALWMDNNPPAFGLTEMISLLVLQGLFVLGCWLIWWRKDSVEDTVA